MPFYEIIEEPTAYWYDDDEPTEHIRWPDDMSDDGFAELYLRAEEAWPNGATIRDAFLGDDRFGDEHPDDVHAHFDD